MPILNFTVNGKPVSVEAKPNEFLAEVLRYKLGLTGTKIGCNEAECGICTVIVDGQPVISCIYPALKAEGAHVETIEGLSNGHLHPLQENFIKFGAVQCGFCTPGLIMQSKALLDKKQSEPVTDEEIKIALKDTYCRCTGYVSVLNAIKEHRPSRLCKTLLKTATRVTSRTTNTTAAPDGIAPNATTPMTGECQYFIMIRPVTLLPEAISASPV